MLSTRGQFWPEDTFSLKARGWRTIYHATGSQKNAGVAILISDKVRFFFQFFYVYLFLRQRETEHEQGRGRKRRRHRIGSRLQVLSHQPRAWRGARTHGPRDRDLSWSRTLNKLHHPGAPKVRFKLKTETRGEDGHYIIITGSIQKEELTFVNIYAPNLKAPACINPLVINMHELIGKNRVITGHFNTPLTTMEKSCRQKLKKETINKEVKGLID